jgi:hypothetical protein
MGRVSPQVSGWNGCCARAWWAAARADNEDLQSDSTVVVRIKGFCGLRVSSSSRWLSNTTVLPRVARIVLQTGWHFSFTVKDKAFIVRVEFRVYLSFH